MADHRASDPLDRLLAGGADAAPGSGERALVDALRRLRGETEQAPADGVAEEHVAAIVALAQEHAHTAPTVAPAAASPAATWRRRLGLAGGISLGKVVLAAGVAAAATGGGLAATGSLPAPAQQAVADVGDRFGITLPAPLDPDDVPDQRRGDDAPVEFAPPEVTPPTESLPTPEPLPTPQVVPPTPPEPGPTIGPPEHSRADPPEDRPTPTEVPPSDPPAEDERAGDGASGRDDDAPPAAAPAPPGERDGDDAGHETDDEAEDDPPSFRIPRGAN